MNSDGESEREVRWYSVRCVFRVLGMPPVSKSNLYEERITLWRAESLDAAIEKAEAEAREFEVATGAEYLKIAQAYWLPDEVLSEGSEVFSLMRESDESPDQYLDAHFDDGLERQQT